MEKKRVLITGAGKGIGRAIALAAAKEGYEIVAHYNHSKESAVRLAEEIETSGGTVSLIQFDITNREDCKKKLDAMLADNNSLWGVVCNAGICADNTFVALSGKDWDSVINTNLNGFYNVLIPLVLPLCHKRKGRIITIASVSGIMGNRGQVNYSASKAGIIGASKALALELASRSITVNCIAPGIIDTEMTKSLPLDNVIPSIPLGHLGTPEEVAATAMFLLSEGASYITRQVISVNGGLI